MRLSFSRVSEFVQHLGCAFVRVIACVSMVVSFVSAHALTGTLTQDDIDAAGVWTSIELTGEVVINEPIVVRNPLFFIGPATIVSNVDGVTFEVKGEFVSFENLSFEGGSRLGDEDYIVIENGGSAEFINCQFVNCGSENGYAVNVNGMASFKGGCKFTGSVGHDVRVGTAYVAGNSGVSVTGDNAMSFTIDRAAGELGKAYAVYASGLTNAEPMEIFYDIPSPCPGTMCTTVVLGCQDPKYFSYDSNDFVFVVKNSDAVGNGLALKSVLHFDEDAVYNIRNDVDGTSIIMGEPGAKVEPLLKEGLGGVLLEEGTLGYRFKSTCGGSLVLSPDWVFYVNDESDMELEIWPYGDKYTINLIDSDYLRAETGSLRPVSDFAPFVLWNIEQLPSGAIIDVIGQVSIPNCTWLAYDYYTSYNIDLSDEEGFACAHNVIVEDYSEGVTFTRELKENWQGICAPIALDKADWEEFGTLWTLAEAIEEVDADGQPALQLRFEETETFEPNTPYLIYVTNPGTLTVEKKTCEVYPSNDTNTTTVSANGATCTLSCVYDFTTLQREDDESATRTYALSGGTFKRPGANGAKLKPYRVMLTIAADGQHPARVSVSTDKGVVTGIHDIEVAPASEQWYDLNGRPAVPGARGFQISSEGKKAMR